MDGCVCVCAVDYLYISAYLYKICVQCMKHVQYSQHTHTHTRTYTHNRVYKRMSVCSDNLYIIYYLLF